MELKPIKQKRIYESIIEQIKELIVAGNLKAGDRLPSERELAEKLQVSRTVVREALTALKMTGLIEIRPGEGTFIRQIDLESVVQPMIMMLLLERERNRVHDLLEVRKALEIECVSLAAEKADGRDLAKMREALQLMESSLDDVNTGVNADLKFHFAIAEASKNPLLIQLMNTIHGTMNETLGTTRSLWLSNTKGTLERLNEEHRSIYRAVRNGDKKKARELMYNHLKKVERELAKWANAEPHQQQDK